MPKSPFFAFHGDIPRIVYTTNAIEALHSSLRKTLRPRGHFPNNESLLKLTYLTLRNIEKRWKAPFRDWRKAQQQLTILFEDRIL